MIHENENFRTSGSKCRLCMYHTFNIYKICMTCMDRLLYSDSKYRDKCELYILIAGQTPGMVSELAEKVLDDVVNSALGDRK